MTAKVHAFEPRAGGGYRMSLTYTDGGGTGKTSDDTDSFEGKFVELVPDERIVEAIRFDSPDPQFSGEMRMTSTLADSDGGTLVTILCENLPPGIRLEDNELGCQQSLAKLARLVE
jgi:uncharacterized protein YndB with AHSA1/START domain